MSIQGLLQKPPSYPFDFITLPFAIPTPPAYGQNSFKCETRSVTSTGGVPTMTAGQNLEDTFFEFLDIDFGIGQFENPVFTISLDDAVNYINYPPFGMVCWEYVSTSNFQIKITTYNAGGVNITNWKLNVFVLK